MFTTTGLLIVLGLGLLGAGCLALCCLAEALLSRLEEDSVEVEGKGVSA